MQSNSPKKRRRRGVILTPEGLIKLQDAKAQAEFQENDGNRYTLEALSERTGLAVDTLMKVFKDGSRVDKKTLQECFQAFDLVLESTDYVLPDYADESSNDSPLSSHTQDLTLEFPEGQVPLNSSYYIERSPIESQCYSISSQPGALMRIKAPRRMGKTSLMTRILHHANQLGYATVSLSFSLADKALFQNPDKFLQWFCASVGVSMQLPNRLSDYWDDLFGSKISSKMYFEQYILPQVSQPLVLGLDDVDRLFSYPNLADDFFGLLRSWHEEAKSREIWKKLRLVVAHSLEVHLPLSVDKSPFNVGSPIELPEFTQEQIQDLASRQGLSFSNSQIQQLMSLVGGHPYLIRLALYHIQHQGISLQQILQDPFSADSIFNNHLQQQLWYLQQHPELATALAEVVTQTTPVQLELLPKFRLQSLGLVHLQANQVTPSCELYAQYFRIHALEN